MRVNKPDDFDKNKEYKIGERCNYNGWVLICVKYVSPPAAFIDKYKSTYLALGIMPTQCGMCRIKEAVDCKGICNSPCFRFNRSDKKM